MRLYSNIGLAQMDEGRNKNNRVRVQIANPDLIVKEKTLKKRMNKNPKSPFEVILKDYNLTGAGVGVTLSLWCPPAAELLVVQEPHSDRSLRDLVVLRDFFHSLAIISALFFESLFAIVAEERALNWALRMLRMAKAGGTSGKARRLLCNCWVKNINTTSSPL